MKRIFISLLLLLLCLSVVSCSAVKESEELDFSFAGIEASAGKIAFEDKTVILGAEGAEINLKYGFYVNEYAHKGTVSEYRIVFRIGESEYSVDYTDGPYDANEFVYIGDYNSGDFDYPKEETVVVPRECFRDSNGSINIEIRGVEGDDAEEQALTAYIVMYYQMLGNSVMISSRALPMHSDLQLEFKYKAVGYSTDNSQAYERYEPSFAKRTLIKYPIDCFAVGEYDTGIAVDGVSQISKYVMIGARVSDKKIRLECYNIDSEKNEASLERAVTLKYSGDYSIEYHNGSADTHAAFYIYLWDDNTVLTFSDNYSNIVMLTEKITASATIADNEENSRVREEIEAGSDVESEKSLGEFKIRAIEKNSKYNMIVAESENGEDIEVYKNSFIGSLLAAVVGFFTSLF